MRHTIVRDFIRPTTNSAYSERSTESRGRCCMLDDVYYILMWVRIVIREGIVLIIYIYIVAA